MDTKKLIGTIIGVTLFAVLIAGATFAWLTFGTTLGENTYTGTAMHFVVDYSKGTDVPYLPILDSKSAKPGVTDSGTVGISETTLGANESSGLVIVMKKNDGSTDGHAMIQLSVTSTTPLTGDGVVRWAICRDDQVETVGEQIDNTCGADGNFTKALNTGKITQKATKSGDTVTPAVINLLNDAKLADGETCTTNTVLGTSVKTGTSTPCKLSEAGGTNVLQSQIAAGTDYMIKETGVSYFVYFWLDGETINNSHLDAQYDANGNGIKDPDETTIVNNLFSGYIHATATQREN